MTEALSQIPLLQLFAGLAAGLALGLFHFATLHRVTALYVGGGSAPKALALQLGRFALLVAGLVLLALWGATALLAGAAGVMIGRAVVLRRNRSAA
ncbi:MAG: N-ATPase subunit AtpR [Salipiger thiooxidans]|uniref:N-ATPase subunit AtpR n=1 Tax=Salipiger thiooxidans TaxID=282683 RepID=UPI001A8FF575|nr:ATP synthase subunit I [Salipiger thiooxidans]MBN8186367.1 hypothetical protein [Salipiger thiooxidans]MBR9836626.1 hypothetical protein [Paracoccaceae bacterium]